jgi:hypothetical protein
LSPWEEEKCWIKEPGYAAKIEMPPKENRKRGFGIAEEEEVTYLFVEEGGNSFIIPHPTSTSPAI